MIRYMITFQKLQPDSEMNFKAPNCVMYHLLLHAVSEILRSLPVHITETFSIFQKYNFLTSKRIVSVMRRNAFAALHCFSTGLASLWLCYFCWWRQSVTVLSLHKNLPRDRAFIFLVCPLTSFLCTLYTVIVQLDHWHIGRLADAGLLPQGIDASVI